MIKSTTRKAFLSSLVSLLSIAALLIGTTFAWFTDSASTGINRIVAGNLDVELEYMVEHDYWRPVDSNEPVFNNEALWEPGFAQVVYLRIRNAGTLALKYRLMVMNLGETPGTNVAGDTFYLSDYLVYGVVEEQTEFESREDAIDAVAPGNALEDYNKEGFLEPGKFHYLTLVVYMPTTVGNEANYLTGTTPPSIDLGISLVATQASHENDSFGNGYDEKASDTWSNIYIKGAEGTFYTTIQAAIEAANDGDTIIIGPGKYVIGSQISVKKSVEIVGAGKYETILDTSGFTAAAFQLSSGKDLTLRNIGLIGNSNQLGIRSGSTDIINKLEVTGCRFYGFKYPIYLNERYGDDAADNHNKVGTLVIEDNEFINVSSEGHAAYIGRGVVDYGSIKNNIVTGSRRGFQIFDCRGEVGATVSRTTGEVTIANNTFVGVAQWPIDLMIGGQVTVTGNNVVADTSGVQRVPLLVLRDTSKDLVDDISGNMLNDVPTTLTFDEDFTHESSPNRDLDLYFFPVTGP